MINQTKSVVAFATFGFVFATFGFCICHICSLKRTRVQGEGLATPVMTEREVIEERESQTATIDIDANKKCKALLLYSNSLWQGPNSVYV